MKDTAHHLKHIQKKVIREARQEQIDRKDARRRARSGNGSESEEFEEEVEAVMDPDNRRKGLTECVRPAAQRDRVH